MCPLSWKCAISCPVANSCHYSVFALQNIVEGNLGIHGSRCLPALVPVSQRRVLFSVRLGEAGRVVCGALMAFLLYKALHTLTCFCLIWLFSEVFYFSVGLLFVCLEFQGLSLKTPFL